MQQLTHHPTSTRPAGNPVNQAAEARYSYYRRCQVFRRNGEQCKAPAEKGAQICHAHAAQQAMTVRRERERQAVLAEAVAEMRRQGKPECETADLFTDFKGIQVTLAVMAQALINGRIDCKTAGRMVVHLQTMSKLLWLYHRGRRRTQRQKALTAKATHSTSLSQAQGRPGQATRQENLPKISADERRLHLENRPIQDNFALAEMQGRRPENVGLKAQGRKDGTPTDAIGHADEGMGVFRMEVRRCGDRGRTHGPPELKAA